VGSTTNGIAALDHAASRRELPELEGLSDAIFYIIGITRRDADRKPNKPFWMA
jgi:uncharacterized protein YjiS (DUF1127 family)